MRKYLLSFLLYFFCSTLYAANLGILMDMTGPIGPATQDYFQRSLEYAEKNHATVLIIRLDTPGGLETSMHEINKLILASPIPIVSFVAPSGARAASAGTYILYASHIAAMAPGTNLGAAAPVSLGGENLEKNVTMDKKVKNDASAYIRSLADLRGRNKIWAEQAVRQAVSLSAGEALKLKVIDIVAVDVPDLLRQINNHTIQLQNKTSTLQTTNMTLQTYQPDWRYQFLSILTNPSLAYILLLIGIYGLFFEFSNPGFILPGIVGVIALLLALYALQLLPVNYAGFALLLLGIACMAAEIYISSFGILGIGGIIAFVTGSILLLDTNVPGFSIAWQLILFMSLISAGFFLMLISLAVRSTRKKIVSGREELLGSIGTVIGDNLVRIHGEIWQARSTHSLSVGQTIRVTQLQGLIVTVEPVEKNVGLTQ